MADASSTPPRGARRRLALACGLGLALLAALAALPSVRRYVREQLLGGRRALAPIAEHATLTAIAPRPGTSLLLITLDTTRADHLGCYGDPRARTPAIDALAGSGVQFDDAVTCVPMTTPSHASILTGLYPPHHGVRNNGEQPLPGERTTLAEILRAKGYATAAFVSAFVLDGRYGLDQGFEQYDARIESSSGTAFGQREDRKGGATTDAALTWLGARDAAHPFFLWVHYYDPHDPYEPPGALASEFRDRPYDGEIAYVDTQVARLIAALERQGLRASTLVALVGDHGESLGEHHEGGHSRLLYEGAMHVPLLFSLPGTLPAGSRVSDRVVSTVDVLPSALQVLGVAPPSALDGLALFGGEPASDRGVYMETLAPLLNNGWAPLFASRHHRLKLIRAPRPELYELPDDASEQDNRYAGDARAAALERELDAWLAGASATPAPGSSAPRDPEESARLAALGYVEGASPDGSIGKLDPKEMMPVWQLVLDSKALLAQAQGPSAATALAEARRKVEQALRLSPRDRSALEQLAKVATVGHRYDEAEQALRSYLAIKPSADACVFLAQLLIEGKRFDEAAKLLDQAQGLDPGHGGIWIARGDLRLRQGDTDGALEAYQQALAVDPYRAQGMANARIAAARARGH